MRSKSVFLSTTANSTATTTTTTTQLPNPTYTTTAAHHRRISFPQLLSVVAVNCWWFLFLPLQQQVSDLLVSADEKPVEVKNSGCINERNDKNVINGGVDAISNAIGKSSNNSSDADNGHDSHNNAADSGESISPAEIKHEESGTKIDNGVPDKASHKANIENGQSASSEADSCDHSKGQWIPDPSPPLYTNDTCPYIQANQDCMLNGRPDRGYLYWKWKPNNCELPRFDPKFFLEMMRGKKVVFIGDSIARNQMQALLCALAQVEDPKNLYYDGKEKEYTWGFMSYNFTLANSWSPFLVNCTIEDELYKLHLDMPDVVWSSPFADYDVAVINTGYWYFRPSVYYMNNTIIGANPRAGLNLTTFEMLPAMRIALETVLKHMADKFKGITVLRTITVPHFENGSWSTGGACDKKQPYFDPEMKMPLPWMNDAMYKIQTEEYNKALPSMPERLKLLDITYSALLRPDGHPGPFRLQKPNEPVNDCLHWCLPGPIDTWNQLLREILKKFFS